LLAASFPKFGHPAFAWMALTPLIVASALAQSAGKSRLHIAALGWLTGAVYFAGTLYWVVGTMATYGDLPWWVAALAGALLVSYVAIFPAVFALLVAHAVRRLGVTGVWLAPLSWVATEWVRSSFGGGFPWVLLGSSQASVIPVVQLASITGVYGLSLLVVLVSAAAAAVVLSRRRVHQWGAAATGAVLVVISVAGLAFGAQAVRGEIAGQLIGLVGADGAAMVQTMIANASKPSDGIIASVIGVVTLLLGATGLFGELQDALNTIWEIAPKPRGILLMIREKFLSFGMVLGIAFLLLVALVVSSGVAAMGQFLNGLLPVPEIVLQAVDFVFSFGIVTLLFAAMFKVLPDAVVAWHDVLIGAMVTSLLFAIGKLLIGLYLGHSGTASTYGAAGSLVVLLLWIYYSAQILFFGAEFTQLYANRYGSYIRPSAKATALADQLRQRRRDRPRRGWTRDS
jgi:membrane protein